MAPVESSQCSVAHLPAHPSARTATPAIAPDVPVAVAVPTSPAPARPTAARSCMPFSALSMPVAADFVRALIFTPVPGHALARCAERLSRCATTGLRPG
jgi:hypothetical protein